MRFDLPRDELTMLARYSNTRGHFAGALKRFVHHGPVEKSIRRNMNPGAELQPLPSLAEMIARYGGVRADAPAFRFTDRNGRDRVSASLKYGSLLTRASVPQASRRHQ